jgi:long-chain acyl-CoA synthetase
MAMTEPVPAAPTLAQRVAELARRHGERTAFVAAADAITWAELDALADRLAATLVARGVVPGDRVGYLGRNHLGYPALATASSRCRATSVGLNWRLPANELAAVLGDAAPRLLFVDPEFADTARLAVDSATIDGVPCELVAVGRRDDLLEWATATPLPPTAYGEPRSDEIAYLIYTSGTTGRPKGVMTSNAALAEHLRTPPPWSLDERANVLIVSPVFHAVGVVWTAFVISNGATGVLVPDPDPATVLAEVEARRITHTVWVPALLQALLDHPDRARRDLSSLETVIYGASPISEQLLERAFACLPGCTFVQGYGMTETTGPVTYLTAGEHVPGSPRLRTAGRAAVNAEVRIVDIDSGQPVNAGQPGEVQTRSAQLASGYWRNPAESANLLAPGGWLRTGDIGVLDDDGYLTLTDRVKDVIVSGGENVYSGEVERVVLAIPGVAEACVVGRPSERWGEAVTAVVVRSPDDAGDALTAEAIIERCREVLAHYKAPSEVHFTETLPRNPSGKVLRRIVRAPFWPS